MIPVDGNYLGYTLRRPVGVVANITPFNHPLLIAARNLAPTFASGCTTVVKPSEYTPLTTIRLWEIFNDAGLPPGVFNIVTGLGASTDHILVGMVGRISAGKGQEYFIEAAGQTARPPLLAQAIVAFHGGQASLVFDGATRYGARDSTSVIGANGVISSQGPDLGHQAVELYTEAGVARPLLTGSWFNDGFAGAMGELLCAIEDGREPLNSARGNLLSLKLCQAALRSVRTGAPVAV